MSEMRTPLSRVRGLGSAKKGTEHFWLQRVTALANIPLAVFFVSAMVAHAGADYVTVTAFLSCLLYTSPSPRDNTGSRMPSSA